MHLFNFRETVVASLVLATAVFCSCNKEGGTAGGGGDVKPDPQDPVTQVVTIKVMSFNILRGDLEGPDHLWSQRRAGALAMIKKQEPYLMGLQECTWTQRQNILSQDKRLKAVGVAVDGQKQDYTNVSSNPIIYRSDIFELQEWGTFWLSDTPDVTGSYTWDASKPRTCTWARFKTRCNGRRFYYFNAHIQNGADGKNARTRSIVLIMDRMQTMNAGSALPVIFGGDMNSLVTSSELSPMASYLLPARDNCPSTDKKNTYNGFNSAVTNSNIIDHLFFAGFSGVKFWVDRSAYEGVTFISDHYPIFTEIKFN